MINEDFTYLWNGGGIKGYQIFVGRIKKLRKQYKRFLSGWEIWYALLGLIFVNAWTSGQSQLKDCSGIVLKTDGIDKKQCNYYPSALAVAEQGCLFCFAYLDFVIVFIVGCCLYGGFVIWCLNGS